MTHKGRRGKGAHSEEMLTVANAALAGLVHRAEEAEVCVCCTMRLMLSSLMLSIAINEPETDDEEMMDMLGEMLSAALAARALLYAGGGEAKH